MTDVYWTGVFIVSVVGGILGLGATIVGAAMALDPVFDGDDATKGARMALAALPTAGAFTFAWPILIPAALVALFWGMWILADLPRPPRPRLPRLRRRQRRRKSLVDPDYIERLERELGIGDDR